jgi:hypothetical protein
MSLLNTAGTVIFLGLLVLSLLAMLDIISVNPGSKHTGKPRRQACANARREARMARKEVLASQRSDRRS